MVQLVPVLLLAFKVWMVIDAVRKSQPYYWFLIIFFLPFGDVVYFFMVKVHDLRWRKLAGWFRSPPSIADLQARYRNARSIENRLALARALAGAGRHVEAIVELEGVCAIRPDEPDALCGLGTSRAALKELPQASAALSRLIAVAPSYGDWEPWVVLARVQRDLGLVRGVARYAADAGAQVPARRPSDVPGRCLAGRRPPGRSRAGAGSDPRRTIATARTTSGATTARSWPGLAACARKSSGGGQRSRGGPTLARPGRTVL